MIAKEEIDEIAKTFLPFQEWTGRFDVPDVHKLVDQELNLPGRRARPLTPLLHIVSGNTPHNVFQTVFRGLLIGAHNLLKLPSSGIAEFERFRSQLSPHLKKRLEVSNQLSDEWILRAQAVVTYGSDQTINQVHKKLRPDQKHIIHGHKTSIALIEKTQGAAQKVAKDITRYNQTGCLSVTNLYVPAHELSSFALELAEELQEMERISPRGAIPSSAAGAINTLRLLKAFDPGARVLQSKGSTAWTIVCSDKPQMEDSPLYRTVFVKALPADLGNLGKLQKHISTVALHPFPRELPTPVLNLPATRFTELGTAQEPTLFWTPDGYSPLSSLVTWQSIQRPISHA